MHVMLYLVGSVRPVIHMLRKPSPGWTDSVLHHVRNVWSRRYISSITAVLGAANNLQDCLGSAKKEKQQVSSSIVRLSKKLKVYIDGSLLLLQSWPRGSGPGEFLTEPASPLDTPVIERGIKREWWLAVVNRAPFAYTRVFVDCFVKPVTRASSCALYFFIPPEYRCKPDVFISHSWDGSIWDLRPPNDVNGVWVDTLVVNQHPVKVKDVKDDSPSTVLDLYPDVGEIKNAIVSIGRTQLCIPFSVSDDHCFLSSNVDTIGGSVGSAMNAVVASQNAVFADLIPFRRSWCVFEMMFTPPGKLSVFLGWNTWKLQEHLGIIKALERLKVEDAETTSVTDKETIDGYVLDRYSSFSEANMDLYRITLLAFVEHVRRSRQVGRLFNENVAKGKDPKEEISFEETGGQPLFDDSILQLYEDKFNSLI